MRTSVSVLVAIVVLVACGGNSVDPSTASVRSTLAPAPTTTLPEPGARETSLPAEQAMPATSVSRAWVLDEVPGDMRPVMVEDLGTERIAYYQRLESRHDLFDSPIVVVTTLDDQSFVAGSPGSGPVTIGEITGIGYELHGDGSHYGSAVTWPDGDHWVTVAWRELVPIEDVVAVARSARPVDDVEWADLLRTLDPDVVIGGDPGDATEVVVAEFVAASGRTYRLVGLVPIDYPLHEDDGRRACYRLDSDDVREDARCDTHPWWQRIGDDTFVFGPVELDVDEIVVQRIDTGERPTDDPPIIVAPVVAPQPSPVAFYVAEISGWCWVTLSDGDTGTDGEDPMLGPIGPLPSDPHHAACLTEASASAGGG